MANPKQLKILKRGFKAWNQWRASNPMIKPDLSRAYLRRENLSESNLSEADLSGAILIGADLIHTNLSGAKLSKANLSRSKLSKANLKAANLCNADLGEANLTGADLSRAILIGAKLIGAKLCGANLSGAKLNGANLNKTILSGAYLSESNLSESNLSEADLGGAYLNEANLRRADLSSADLQRASLRATRLINANLEEANLTEACLWETQRAGWSIKGIICESVYWDREAKEKTIYQLGEFERLFAEKTRIKLLYKDGINPLEIATLPALIKHLEEEHPGCSLRLVSISEDSGGVAVELAIEETDNYSPDQLKRLQVALEAKANQAVEFERKFLAEKEQRLYLEGRLDELRLWHKEQLLLASSKQTHIESYDIYNISGQVGAAGSNAHAKDMKFNQQRSQKRKSPPQKRTPRKSKEI